LLRLNDFVIFTHPSLSVFLAGVVAAFGMQCRPRGPSAHGRRVFRCPRSRSGQRRGPPPAMATGCANPGPNTPSLITRARLLIGSVGGPSVEQR